MLSQNLFRHGRGNGSVVASRWLLAASLAVAALGCTRDRGPTKEPSRASSSSASPPPVVDHAVPHSRSKLVEDGIGSGPARVQTAAEATATGDADCPKYVGQRSTAADLSATQVRALPHELGWALQSRQGISVVEPTSAVVPPPTPAGLIPKGIAAFDDDAWYVPHCQPGGCSEHGTGVVIDRVDRVSGKATQLVPPQSEVVTAEVLGDYLYWATFGPYGDSGELRRIHRSGGAVETLWSGGGVAVMRLEPGVAFVADSSSVVEVPLTGGAPVVLADHLQEVRAIDADAHDVYIAELGDPYWASAPSGYIKRVARTGGAVATLVGPIKSPSVVAVDDDRVYYMLADAGYIWGMAKGASAPPEMVVPQPPRDSTCQRSIWLRADATGLIWLRQVEGFGKGTLWRLRRTYLPPPPDTAIAAFRRAIEALPAATSTAAPASPAGSDHPH